MNKSNNKSAANDKKKLKEELTERSRDIVESGKNELAKEVNGFAKAIYSKEQNRDSDSPMSKALLSNAQRMVEHAGDYLQQNSLGTIMEDFGQVIRKRPEIAIGGLFVGGIIMSRFLKGGVQSELGNTGATTDSSAVDVSGSSSDEDSDSFSTGTYGSASAGGHSVATTHAPRGEI